MTTSEDLRSAIGTLQRELAGLPMARPEETHSDWLMREGVDPEAVVETVENGEACGISMLRTPHGAFLLGLELGLILSREGCDD